MRAYVGESPKKMKLKAVRFFGYRLKLTQILYVQTYTL